MRYRAVEKSDGRFWIQYRVCFFWWSDSCAMPRETEAEAAKAAQIMNDLPPRVVRRVWP